MSAVRDCHRPPFSFWEVFMRRVTAVFTTSLFLSLSAWAGAVAAPMVQAVTDQPPMVQAVTDPAPYGPGRRGRDAGSALRPSCHRSFRRLRSGRMEPSIQQGRLLPGAVPLHQGARGPSARAALRALAVAMANVAGKKPDAAKPLLKELIAKDNASAMLVLAYISPEAEAAKLMEKAADTGNANAMMLYGMTLMTGKGVPKDTLAGVRLVRRAADAGSTRAMLLMANFYNQGVHGVGLDHGEATDLIIEAAHLGDPSAKALLINLQRGGTSGTTPQ